RPWLRRQGVSRMADSGVSRIARRPRRAEPGHRGRGKRAVEKTPSVRGMLVLNAFDFVRAHYSPESHTAVLAMLPGRRAAPSAVRANSWVPLEDLVAYMEQAKALLAPGDPDFYRKMGFYGGRHVRALPIAIAVSEGAQAVRLGGIVWRALFDGGEIEVVETCPEGAILRIH